MPGLSEVLQALGMMSVLTFIMVTIVTVSMLGVWWFFRHSDHKNNEQHTNEPKINEEKSVE